MRSTTTETTRRLGSAPDPSSLDPAERMGIDELRALQLERLQWTLRHAYENVPHYRAAFDAAGVHPDDCRELADLAKFPTTSKADLRDNYPFGMFAVPQDQVSRIHASSGTTGRPTVVGYTERRTSTPGPRSWPAPSGRPAAAPATSCTTPTATACSPAGWARTTARRSSAAPSSRSPAA